MTLLMTLVLLFSNGSGGLDQDRPCVRILVISQQLFKNLGHHPENNRRVIFKMVNDSNKPVIVYGFRTERDFLPAGYLMKLDEKTMGWRYPNPDNAPTMWAERSDLDKHRYTLLPGKSITFQAEMSRVEVGAHFRRTAYVSFKEGEEPLEIRGDEFVLK